ncbi:MAG: ABC transporter family substrate-binding protein [Candidatus Nanopelagicales bacterium]
MLSARSWMGIGAAAAVSLALGAVPGPDWPQDRGISQSSSITAAWDAPLFTVNTATANGGATANSVITSMTNSGFWFYDQDLQVNWDTSFGTVKLVSEDPLTVTYTFADGNVWSDGTPVNAADMLLEWAATSGHFNTVDLADLHQDEDGKFVDEAGKPVDTSTQVFFNAASDARAQVRDFPEISEDGKAITFVYRVPRADWATLFNGPTVPGHIVAEEALGIADPALADAALIAAFRLNQRAELAKIAEFWSTGFDFTSLPRNRSVLVSNGPFVITSYVQNQYLTLTRSESYTGLRAPAMQTITVRYITDPMGQVTALRNGEVDLIGPQATADVRTALTGLGARAEVDLGTEAVYEHITTNFLAGAFSPQAYGGDEEKARLVRRAFLSTVPRERIVDSLIRPLNEEAQVRNSLLVLPGAPNYAVMTENNGSLQFPSAGDLEQARKLLEKAGVSTPVRVRFTFNGDNARRANQFVLIRESAQRAGFNVVDASRPAASFSQTLSGGRDSWDCALFAWSSTSTSVMGTDSTYRTGGSNNHGSFDDPQVNALFDALSVEPNPALQIEIQIEIEKILWHEGVSLPIFQFPAITAWSSGFTGIHPSMLSPFMFATFWNWEEVK